MHATPTALERPSAKAKLTIRNVSAGVVKSTVISTATVRKDVITLHHPSAEPPKSV